ncbi:rRNA methyltransferase 1, mitochondrial [Austrofundulus limnaeus]|uniref:rRNA methyltransferase 1, mitochondrial n=1 Tax=Austrofundulus limnaeus TaxID=52670 RepID=A0A2I4BR02_AUSLI|nr:PREDICTED: rRNA methyltransferase 1, mitochondrial [Austrofundulus limnaeus]
MWSCAHKFNLIWGRNMQTLVPTSRVGFQSASYHRTACLLSPEDRDLDSHSRVGERPRRSPSLGQRPKGVQGSRRSSQSKPSKIKTPLLQNQWTDDTSKVSSELRKLCLEDFPAERKKQMRAKAAVDPKGEVVFGVAPCLLALTQRRRKAYELLVKDGKTSQRASVVKVFEEARRQGVQITRVSKSTLDRVSSRGVHQGVCLRASPLSFLTVDSEPEVASGVPLWLVLERILDPMNLGAILRSAYFLGVDRVVSSLHHGCPLTPVVSKASSGAMEVMRVYGHKNLEDLLKLKAAEGWQIVGTVGAEAERPRIPVVPCSDFNLSKPTMLLLGSEGDGLSQRLLSLCETLLTIPPGRDLCRGIESLNVSVATGVMLHTLLHQRNSSRHLKQQRTKKKTL